MVRLTPPTEAVHLGRPKDGTRLVNPATEAGSTVLFPDYASFRARVRPFFYGRAGTPTHRALEASLCALENAEAARLTSCGLSACTLVLQAFAERGGHLLVADNVYDPTRYFCVHELSRLGVEVTFFDPLDMSALARAIRPTTRLIFCETPGSLTFELTDLPALIAVAGAIPVAVDNTWGAGVALRPLDLGAAISVQALTKYVAGHSDCLMGAVMMRGAGVIRQIAQTARSIGHSVSAADVALVHRGLRTLHTRYAQQGETGLRLAAFLAAQPEVAAVIHPARTDHPQHAIWLRDFGAVAGLFAFRTRWTDEAMSARFIDAMELFGLGYSWGGFESLLLPTFPADCRSAVPFTPSGAMFRVSAGLESVDDLTDDLKRGFDAVRAG